MGRYRRYSKNNLTNLGTPFVKMLNKTGASSVKGMAIALGSTIDNSFKVPTTPFDIVGIVYEEGQVDGNMTKVVLSGLVEALLEDGSTAGYGGWMRASSDQLGRIVNTTGPEGLGALAAAEHFKEVGHSCGLVGTGGTDQIVKIIFHQL